jgi:hypothetical protein
MRGLSSESEGMRVGLDPVARMQCSKASSESPSAPAMVIDFGPVSVARPLDELYFAHPPDLADATRQLVDDSLLEGAQLIEIDFRIAERHAPRAGVPRFVDHLGHVQQRLRRYAAAIQADAARILLHVDERDLHAEIGGVERPQRSRRAPRRGRPVVWIRAP